MTKSNVIAIKNPVVDPLTELLRNGAQRLIAVAVEAELEAFLSDFKEDLSGGKARVVRNGYLPKRQILTGIGPVDVRVPRVRDRSSDDEAKVEFKSSLIPRYLRRTDSVNDMLPLLYLKGLSEASFVEALTPLFGERAKNLSPSVISRLKEAWESEYEAFSSRPLDSHRYVYWWVDGVNFHVRDDDKRSVLVVIGVNELGEKKLLALADGYRESTESWLSLLRDMKKRGLNTPSLAVGDGALGFWNAVSEVYPQTQHQRCWFHKMGNVLDKLPKSQQGRAKSMLQEIWMSATRTDAHTAFKAFIDEYDAKYPKATECLRKDKAELLAFYDFPAEHWVHLRTTNPIESTFATVKNRTYKAKGCFSAKTILTMTFKLMQSAEKRWKRLRGFHHLSNVITGIKFVDGKMSTDNLETATEAQNRIAA